MQPITYPVQFTVDYPNHPLNKITTAFRFFVAIPIFIVLATLTASNSNTSNHSSNYTLYIAGGSGLLVLGPLLMIVVRQKYPRWWFDWNRELLRFINRVFAFMALLDDQYPSTDEQQSVHLDFAYPEMPSGLNQWLPLVKWFLAIPHYFVLVFWNVALVFVVIYAWFAILFTGHYPQSMFDFVVGVMRWNNRVIAYAFILVTDEYPPFRLSN